MCNADKDEYESGLRRNEQYLTNSENKVWKKKKIQACLGFEPRWYRCSFLPTEPISQLGAEFFDFKYTWINTTDKDVIMKAIFMNASWFSVIYSSRHGFIASLNFSVFGFFSGLIFTTAQVVKFALSYSNDDYYNARVGNYDTPTLWWVLKENPSSNSSKKVRNIRIGTISLRSGTRWLYIETI